jgi:hypothetical protein
MANVGVHYLVSKEQPIRRRDHRRVYSTMGIVTQCRTVPTSIPTIFLYTQISHLSAAKAGVRYDGEPGAASTWSEDFTSSFTVHLYASQSTDLLRGIKREDLPCELCPTADYRLDPQCEARGLQTACQGQCKEKDGIWECRQTIFGE